jgi:hypothetical protein
MKPLESRIDFPVRDIGDDTHSLRSIIARKRLKQPRNVFRIHSALIDPYISRFCQGELDALA